jgi:hypothetical protein
MGGAVIPDRLDLVVLMFAMSMELSERIAS